ncbi:hypothetical protein FHX68_1122 [Microbacterium lacticum]|uniref:Uncharacterized protein n=1 Tax=Microbacterium lacticum TaxID=33885 RepID=A0A4Y3UQ47_9MICO|nr:hypothetical protein FHX68_1122 [Microbacterium lacticum]GEB96493.1 hypothetical protein MLA01_27120 [Microbacterium lacticum]GGI75014.1 hypothetical protein GCM10009724_27390 [Microbacterium lacticum]
MNDNSHDARRLRTILRLASLVAIVGVFCAVAWFAFAAAAESGSQMAGAGATAAGLGAAWSAAFAAIKSRIKSLETAAVSGARDTNGVAE